MFLFWINAKQKSVEDESQRYITVNLKRKMGWGWGGVSICGIFQRAHKGEIEGRI